MQFSYRLKQKQISYATFMPTTSLRKRGVLMWRFFGELMGTVGEWLPNNVRFTTDCQPSQFYEQLSNYASVEAEPA